MHVLPSPTRPNCNSTMKPIRLRSGPQSPRRSAVTGNMKGLAGGPTTTTSSFANPWRISERSLWHPRLRKLTFGSALSAVCERGLAGRCFARSRDRSYRLRNRSHDGSPGRHRPTVFRGIFPGGTLFYGVVSARQQSRAFLTPRAGLKPATLRSTAASERASSGETGMLRRSWVRSGGLDRLG